MSDIVKFDPVAAVVMTLEDPREETRTTVTLKATSILGRDIFVQISVAPRSGSQAGWFTIPDSVLRFQVKAGQPFQVPVTVTIPAGTPFDKYGFKVLAADDAAPERDFTDAAVVIERRQGAPKHGSWWKWVAAGAGVAAVATILAVLLLRGPSWLDACDPATPKCPASGRCPAEVKKCLAPKGLACDKDDVCLSGKCREHACAAAVLGDACYPSESACEGTGQLVGCFGKPGKCASLEGGPCRTAADCVDGACTPKDGAGPLVCGDAIKQEGCEIARSAEQCPADQECVAASNGKRVCLYKGGTVCPALHGGQGGQALCASQRCNDAALCAPSDGTCVAKNHDCGPNNDCVAGHCKTPSGGQVKVFIDWSTISTAAVEVLTQKRATNEKRVLLLQNRK